MVDGGTFNGETITGIRLTKAANILWRALSVYEIPVSDFADHADAVEQSCADLVGATLGEPVTTAPSSWTSSSRVISAADCAAVAAAISAVELRDPPPCVITPILQPNPPALCSGAGAIETIALADFESGLAPWSAGLAPWPIPAPTTAAPGCRRRPRQTVEAEPRRSRPTRS